MIEILQPRVWWSLLRFPTYLLLCVYSLLGLTYGLVVEHSLAVDYIVQNGISVVMLFVCLALWYIAGTAANDYADYEIDAINLQHDPSRPLVNGQIARRQLLIQSVVASVVCLCIAWLSMPQLVTVFFSLAILLSYAYSLPPFKLSRRGVAAPLFLPLGYVILTVGSGYLLSLASFTFESYLLLIAMYVHFMARILLKDYRDVAGDYKMGKKTPLLLYGSIKVCISSIILTIISTWLLSYIVWQFSVTTVVCIVFLSGAAILSLRKLSTAENWPHQKPLIGSFGRFCSGIVAVTIIAMLTQITSITDLQTIITLAAVTAIITVSTQQQYRITHFSK